MRFERAGAAAVLNVYLGKKGLRLVPGGRDAELLSGDIGLAPSADAAPATGSPVSRASTRPSMLPAGVISRRSDCGPPSTCTVRWAST